MAELGDTLLPADKTQYGTASVPITPPAPTSQLTPLLASCRTARCDCDCDCGCGPAILALVTHTSHTLVFKGPPSLSLCPITHLPLDCLPRRQADACHPQVVIVAVQAQPTRRLPPDTKEGGGEGKDGGLWIKGYVIVSWGTESVSVSLLNKAFATRPWRIQGM